MDKLIVFDFDGVLAIPYTDPEEHYSQIPHLIRILASKYTLAIASFNPRAIESLERWGIIHYFSCIRAGSNDSWDVYDNSLRINLSKKIQIVNILGDMSHKTFSEIFFYDDDPKNIIETKFCSKNINSILIDNEIGFDTLDCNKHITFNHIIDNDFLHGHPTPWLVKIHPLLLTIQELNSRI